MATQALPTDEALFDLPGEVYGAPLLRQPATRCLDPDPVHWL